MTEFTAPGWCNSSNIYEVNLRQYTQEGTCNSFRKHLPRLRDMGVEILWFMPLTPISLSGRKGTLGSYYAVADYKKVSTEFGSQQELKELIDDAHAQGFKVIIDWVANHSGNDNNWIIEHPDYFVHEHEQILHPNGWDDVSKLNYDNAEMREAMLDAMAFWIKEFDIDGYRCDMAHLVPLDFWITARRFLNTIKPGLFWLAECEDPAYHASFDATYTWKWMHASEDFYKQKLPISSLVDVLYAYDRTFTADSIRTYFTSNHDENSWNGTEYEKYGEAAKLFAVFSCTWNGIPMVYSGQEIPNLRRLQFFDKDEMDWSSYSLHLFYKTLLSLHKNNPALRAADPGVYTEFIQNDHPENILSFRRKSGEHEVTVVLNCSEQPNQVHLPLTNSYEEVFLGIHYAAGAHILFELEPWGYRVLQRSLLLPA